jgi:seryl-tRNA synthetase
MIDIKFIRENPDKIKEAVRKKMVDFDVDYFLQIDQKRKKLIQDIEELNKIKNQASKEIQNAKDAEQRKTIIAQMQELDRNSDDEEGEYKKIDEEFQKLMLLIPNIPDESVPEGKSDADNIETKKWGKIRKFNFTVKDHVQLAKDLDLVDFERGTKVSGFRGYFLKNEGFLLCMAIWNYALEVL